MSGTVVTLRQAFGILADVEYQYITRKHQEFVDMGCNYDSLALRIAHARGWKPQEHIDALLTTDDDAITMTHPINFLDETEAEVFFP